MVSFTFILILVSVLTNFIYGVKVDVKGSLSLGKEVVSALRAFVNKNGISGRRALGSAEPAADVTENDTIALIVYSAFICRDIEFCRGDLGRLVSQYIIALTKSIESVLIGLIDNTDTNHNQDAMISIMVEAQLKQLIRYVKNILKQANLKITDASESYTWINLLKKINVKFHDATVSFAEQNLSGNVQKLTKVKTKLMHKLVIESSEIELKFIDRLCIEHNICSKSHEVTKALNIILLKMKEISDDNVKEFIRHFYETLPDTNFYYRISDITGHEFQTILHDMAYGDNIPNKNVLAIVHKTIQERIDALRVQGESKAEETVRGRDVKLVHVILSDLDHFYSEHKKEPFHEFLGDFFEWAKIGGNFRSKLRRMMMDLQNDLSLEADDLVYKLVKEVRVFMEITVDPDL